MQQIGFIGLGVMGRPMALNLIRAGFGVGVLEQSKACDELMKAGARPFQTPKHLAESSDVVITMLPDTNAVETAVFGPDGVWEGLRSGSFFIDMSSMPPELARSIHDRMQAKGVAALDAPVSGGEVGAIKASLSIMVGGDEAAFEQVLPILKALGQHVTLVGPAGAGQMAKACNQLIVGITIQAVSEALALARHAGVKPEKMRQALLPGFAGSRVLDLHGQRMIDGDFVPGAKLTLHQKDLHIALAAAQSCQLELPITGHVASLFDAAVAQGLGDMDHSALSLLLP